MLITKDKLNLAKYVGKDNRKRELDNLYLDQNKATVSNGHTLVQIEDIPPTCENFPHIKGMENIDYTPDKILVTASTATKVSKNLPKNKTLPIINNALIEADKDGDISFGLTDLDSSIVIRQRKEEGLYPDTDIAIPKEEPRAKVDVSVKYLQKIVGALNEFLNSPETGRIEISLYDPENAMVIRGKKNNTSAMTALIMPLRKNE